MYDVIIIGGGLGGLTAGARLAKEGKRVLLIEQHNKPGGCATTFRRKDYLMEVGLHEMDGLDEKDLKREIFKELGVVDSVDFIKLPEFYRVKNKRLDIVVPASIEEAIKVLTERFPEDKNGIKRFFNTIHAIRREINKLPRARWKVALLFPVFPLLYPHLAFNTFKTLGNFLDSTIKSEDLKLILSANLPYYHDDPYSLSLVYFGAAQASYYNGGGYFIKGGSQKLSDHLAQVIRNNGGEILIKNLVTKIIIKKGKAAGIEYKGTSGGNARIKNAFAKVIISNAAIPNVASMLPEKERPLLEKRINKLEKSCSLISIYIGFRREVKEMGNMCYSTFVIDESVKRLTDVAENLRGDISKRSFVFVDYSQIDSGLAPEGKGFGAICSVDYLSAWDQLGREDYKNRKEEVARIFFRRLEKLIPGITREIEYYEVGTPKTIQRYTLNPEGSVYGFAQIPKQAGIFRLPNKSPVKNLYFASAWTSPGGGFTGAILSGWFCANEVSKVLGKNKKTPL